MATAEEDCLTSGVNSHIMRLRQAIAEAIAINEFTAWRNLANHRPHHLLGQLLVAPCFLATFRLACARLNTDG
jgi:hypothetical protein